MLAHRHFSHLLQSGTQASGISLPGLSAIFADLVVCVEPVATAAVPLSAARQALTLVSRVQALGGVTRHGDRSTHDVR
jgi:hypothetical protein